MHVAIPGCPGCGAAPPVAAVPPLTGADDVADVAVELLLVFAALAAFFPAAYNKRNTKHMVELTSLKR